MAVQFDAERVDDVSRALQVPRISVTLLEGFALSADGRPAPLPLSCQRLTAFLALHPRSVTRAYVAGMLWPETTDDRATANLRSALWRLRRVVPGVIVATRDHLELAPDIAVDVRSAAALCRELISGVEIRLENLRSACASLSGEVLEGWYEDWALAEREVFHQLRLHALEALCRHLVSAGNMAQAVEAGLAAVNCEPLRESAQRELIKAFVAEGNSVTALRQYQAYSRLLRSELGVEPSRELKEIVSTISS